MRYITTLQIFKNITFTDRQISFVPEYKNKMNIKNIADNRVISILC